MRDETGVRPQANSDYAHLKEDTLCAVPLHSLDEKR